MLWLLLLVLLTLPSSGVAQTRARKKTSAPKQAAATPDKWPIATITVTGNKAFTSEQVIAAAGVKLGQLAGKTDFDAARDRLLATGMFETAGYQFGPAPNSKGYAAAFEVVEITPLFAVRFEGLGANQNEVDAWLRSKDTFYRGQLPGTVAVLDSYARQIERYLASQNHPEKVVGKLVATGPNQFQIVFRSASALPAVADVTFEGNEVVPTTALQHAISEVAFGLPFSEDVFRQLLDTQVRPVYDARGRIAVSFPKVTSEPSTKVKGVIVHVTVKEGPSYELGKVSIHGAADGEDAGLLKIANIKTGDIANFDDVNQGVERVKKSLQKNGYLHAEALVERKVDEKAKKVDVAITLHPGPQFHFGKLTIQGLDLNSEPVIRKIWGIKEGGPFNADYPNYFLDRIREDGLFDNLGETKAFTQIDEEKHIADVTLRFTGAPPPDEKHRKKTTP